MRNLAAASAEEIAGLPGIGPGVAEAVIAALRPASPPDDHQVEADDHQVEADDHQVEADDHQVEADDHQVEADDHRVEADGGQR